MKRRVYRVVAHVEQPRRVLSGKPVKDADCFGRQSVREVFAFRTVFQMGELIRTEKAIVWMSFPTTGNIDAETLIGGQMRFVVVGDAIYRESRSDSHRS